MLGSRRSFVTMCARTCLDLKAHTAILPNNRGGNVTPSAETSVSKFIKTIELPGLGRTIADVGLVNDVSESENSVKAHIELGFPAESRFDAYRAHIAAEISAQTGSPSQGLDPKPSEIEI